MPLPTNKVPPFKTMDIKTAFLASANRKRKATSTQICQSEPKSLKLSVDSSNRDSDVEILDEACGIKLTVEKELDPSLGDCKENKDINAAKLESCDIDCEGNKQSPSKDEFPIDVNNVPTNELKLANPKSPKSYVDSVNDVELLSEKSKNSDSSSCDELESSVNVSLNTSGLSITAEDDNDDKGNTSISQNESTEKVNEKSSDVVKAATKKKKMTPAEAQKRAEEREMKQKERMLKKQELENKKRERLMERERQKRQKMIKKEREEMERKERERMKQEKKEQEEKERLQKQKEKEEKLKHKQFIYELKIQEKKRKEEMKQKREEEIKRAEEERLRAKLEKEQKEKEKKERAKAAFVKFFVKGNANSSTTTSQAADKTPKEVAFLPFQVSDDMILAPVVPPAAQERFNKKQLDHHLECQDGGELYLQILKSGSYKDVRQRKKNRKLDAAEADIIVIDTNAQAEISLCPKLLQFSENVRPPYWGTWRKRSKNVGPRRPFGQDEIFDYSVDSDDEWDEGGPGESLSGTEQEDVESEDEYEVDNEFFVPHGYLSDEEEKKEDDGDEDNEETNDPEKQKALLKIKLQQFEMERKKKTTELKPIILGCCFVKNSTFQDNGLEVFLKNYSAELLTDSPIQTSFSPGIQQTDYYGNKSESPKSSNGRSKKIKYLQMPEEAFPHLIRLVHGSTKNKRILSEEFQRFWGEQSGENREVKQGMDKPPTNADVVPMKEAGEEANQIPSDSTQISLTQLRKTIGDIASYGKPPESAMFNKCCWWVLDNVREKYGLMDAPIPNQWKYVSQKEPEPQAKVDNAAIKEFLSSK